MIMVGKSIKAAAAAAALVAAVTMAPASTWAATTAAPAKSGYEIEGEYLHSMHFKDRSINTYNVHILKYAGTTHLGRIHGIDWYRGLTVSRPIGTLVENHVERDSAAAGLGYTFLVRKEKPLGSHFSMALDASGGLMFYDKAFPATGRAYEFMWRIGPRLLYHMTDTSSLVLGWTYMHVSNGLGTRNPGYNGGGLTLGYNRLF